MSKLGPHNFRRIGLKRMVVAAVVDPEESLAAQGAEALMYEASKGFHADIREAFAFGVLDGRRWDEYIATFDLTVSDLPRVLVLDRPSERFSINIHRRRLVILRSPPHLLNYLRSI